MFMVYRVGMGTAMVRSLTVPLVVRVRMGALLAVPVVMWVAVPGVMWVAVPGVVVVCVDVRVRVPVRECVPVLR